MKNKKMPHHDLEEIMPLLLGVWRRFHKLAGPADVLQTREFRSVVAAVQTLQRGLETGRDLVGQDYFSQPDLLGAYILYQWVVHYQQGLSLINELPFTPRRVLDLCSGPAPFACAALRHGASHVVAMDRNMTALQLGAEICGRYGLPLTLRRGDCLKSLNVEGSFDLIIAGYCLEELFPDTEKNWRANQNQFINRLLNLLTPEGSLLLVENSLLPSNRRVLELRDHLVKAEVPIQAPCVWQGECPALQTKNSPCYAQREFEKPYLIKEIQRAAQINLNSLKMSYLIVNKPGTDWPALPPKPLYRVISPPVDTYQGKRYYLCGTDGKKDLGSQLSTHPTHSRAFEFLRRGELISIEEGVDRHNHIDITADTKVRVEAAAGKPLPELESEDF
jgi:SAM-dependent methyltransferase